MFLGTSVLQVSATDPEAGAYGVIIYELSPGDSSDNYDHFAVDRNTGDITVRHPLNYVLQNEYR